MNQRRFARTARACYAGIVNQAVITNVTALLFVPFMTLYGFTYMQLGLLTAVNFAAQMCADIVLLFIIDRVSFRKLTVFACMFSFIGLTFYGLVPWLFPTRLIYTGVLCATTVFAFAGGMSEVVLSNIADNLPKGENSLSICLLKTVYAWAQVGLVAVCAAFLFLCGVENWNCVMFAFAVIPLVAACLIGGAKVVKKSETVRPRSSFSIFYVLALVAIFLGYGSEITVNQWISSFAASAFGLQGAWCEFVGMGLFALCLGLGGLVYVNISKRHERFPLPVLIFAALFTGGIYVLAGLAENAVFALISAVCCGLFVGVLSPGIMTVAGDTMPSAGAWMIASLAICADIGAATLPAVGGAIADFGGVKGAFLLLSAAPFVCAAVLFWMYCLRRRQNRKTLY